MLQSVRETEEHRCTLEPPRQDRAQVVRRAQNQIFDQCQQYTDLIVINVPILFFQVLFTY